MPTPRSLRLILLACACLGCESREASDPKPAAEPRPKVEDPPSLVDSGKLVVNVVEPRPLDVTWHERSGPDEHIVLIAYETGVLARGTETWGFYTVDASGELVARPELGTSLTSATLGHWPKDAWYIQARVDRFENGLPVNRHLRLMNWTGSGWAPRHYGELEWFPESGHEFRNAGRGGILVRSEDLVRVGGDAPAPTLGLHRGELELFVESRSGRLYTVSRDGGRLFAQRDCEDAACVDVHAVELPLAVELRYGVSISRNEHDISVQVSIDDDEDYLLHYERETWRLEQLGESHGRMWPTAGGGLWLEVHLENTHTGLWYRAPTGEWFDVAMPRKLSDVDVAIDLERGELWMVGMAGLYGRETTVSVTDAEPHL